MQANPELAVMCCDRDRGLATIFRRIHDTEPRSVDFRASDLSHLPFADASFTAIYCISVLEHTENWPAIVEEFHRVLKPGGRLIVTYDIALDGRRDIPPTAAKALLALLCDRFAPFDAPPIDTDRQGLFVHRQSIFENGRVTFWTLLRWCARVVMALLGRGRMRASPMTVYCGEFQRADS